MPLRYHTAIQSLTISKIQKTPKKFIGGACLPAKHGAPSPYFAGRHPALTFMGVFCLIMNFELPPSYTKQRHPAICRDGRIRMYHPRQRGF
jgi:hypothetical protein